MRDATEGLSGEYVKSIVSLERPIDTPSSIEEVKLMTGESVEAGDTESVEAGDTALFFLLKTCERIL